MFKIFLVFIGGGIGSVSRYSLSGLVYKIEGSGFPYGTFAVNIIGSFLIGLFLTMSQDRFLISPQFRVFVAIGIIGGFTTFSTFSFETVELLKDGSFTLGLLNIAVTVLLGLTATWAGTLFGKII